MIRQYEYTVTISTTESLQRVSVRRRVRLFVRRFLLSRNVFRVCRLRHNQNLNKKADRMHSIILEFQDLTTTKGGSRQSGEKTIKVGALVSSKDD